LKTTGRLNTVGQSFEQQCYKKGKVAAPQSIKSFFGTPRLSALCGFSDLPLSHLPAVSAVVRFFWMDCDFLQIRPHYLLSLTNVGVFFDPLIGFP
jgi:hypothetical protein